MISHRLYEGVTMTMKRKTTKNTLIQVSPNNSFVPDGHFPGMPAGEFSVASPERCPKHFHGKAFRIRIMLAGHT